MDPPGVPVCLITGATSGIGAATAKGLARQGLRLAIVGRSARRTERMRDVLLAAGAASVEVLLGDLSEMREVERVARSFLARNERLDLLINNAGAFHLRRHLTSEGLEHTFALNHLAYFLLTRELLPLIEDSAPARIVVVSSDAHVDGRLDFDDLQSRSSYRGWRAYARSKLANILFTRELARRLEPGRVTVNAMHPGFVATGIGANHNPLAWPVRAVLNLRARSPEEGADTILWLATSEQAAGTTGRYFVDREEVTPSPDARDDAAASLLWDRSEQILEEVLEGAQV